VANWTARAEYLYVDLNDRTIVLSGEIESARIGVNYRF
jgi:opacity protein-like surface antigen